ncbi:uncharacterized protein DSM5745_07094 [Aspergillus mulundensis]|uniref:BTB domain-containing protein n=1 Tax=Aspergillus mulundensis TaxID=1810919 RepID=A0A3D8RK57_9EURO|nr:hypothetical protein DSM5745_07094 [Aspergillus mulundensis]RDW74432.1 hypothetical protein DSM5745_07094 [Aspergillus mulundensis]
MGDAGSAAPTAGSASTQRKSIGSPVYELDPDGDVTLVVHDVPQDLPSDLKDLTPELLAGNSKSPKQTTSGQTAEQRPLSLRASSKHLGLASRYFSRMFKSGFREGNELRNNGHIELVIKHEKANGIAFLVLMLIIHCRNSQVPRVVSREMLTAFAVLVDYYDCCDAVEVFSDMWIAAIEQGRIGYVHQALDWLLISWVFSKDARFRESSGVIITACNTTITANGLPIPGAIIDMMDNKRTSFLQILIDDLHKQLIGSALDCLKHSKGGNREICTASVFGTFTKRMVDLDILTPKPQSPFPGIQIWKLLSECSATKMQSPCITDSHSPHDRCRLSARMSQVLQSHPKPAGLELNMFREGKPPSKKVRPEA